MDDLGKEAGDVHDLVQQLTFANVYCLKFKAERESSDEPQSFSVQVDPYHLIEDQRVDYLFTARCEPTTDKGDRVGFIEVSMIATFDVESGVDVIADYGLEAVEWIGGNVALFATYPYLREAIQAHAARLGMPNITMDLLKRGEPLPAGLTIRDTSEEGVADEVESAAAAQESSQE